MNGRSAESSCLDQPACGQLCDGSASQASPQRLGTKWSGDCELQAAGLAAGVKGVAGVESVAGVDGAAGVWVTAL